MPKRPLKNKFISPALGKVTEQQREKLNGHRSAIIWLTGLPASGKTTIAFELEYRLFKMKTRSFVMDGDNIRGGLSADLGFSIEDRVENIRRAGEVSKLFASSGIIAIASFISPFRASRDDVRHGVAHGKFIEVFVDCPLKICEKRDPKGHYAKARRGEIRFFTGISSPYESPVHPEIHLKTHRESVNESVEKVMTYLKHKGLIPKL